MIPNFPGRRRQRGITLVVVLLLLVIVTLLGLAAMRGSIMQERMSGNINARGVAFQAAEAGLRDAEQWLIDQSTLTVPTSGCSGGVCAMPAVGAAPAYETANFWTTSSGHAAGPGDGTAGTDKVAVMRWMVEPLGTGSAEASAGGPAECLSPEGDESGCAGAEDDTTVRNFRITAFAQSVDGAQVLLQSTFQMP